MIDQEAAAQIEDLEAENERLRANEWSYESLARILADELPMTMTLGLVEILVRRMVQEKLFAVDGLVVVVKRLAHAAAESESEVGDAENQV
jgi:hypothetical protein